MHAEERRETILKLLRQSAQPVSASTLAGQLSVSRQIIVGDIALLRAGGADILAPEGTACKMPPQPVSPAGWPSAMTRQAWRQS